MMRPEERFDDRVEDYVKYRPTYPGALLDALDEALGGEQNAPIADLGAGTGIFSRLLLERGHEVYAVEPSQPMRAAAVAHVAAHPRHHEVAGRAEATTLASESVAMVVAAQSFHWFDPVATKAEAERILRMPRIAALVWNERRTEGAFLSAYERFLHEHATDYAKVDSRNTSTRETMAAFFDDDFRERVFENEQTLDRPGLFGRALSSSYVPVKGHPKHEAMIAALARLWDEHGAAMGSVVIRYDTRLFLGTLSSPQAITLRPSG